MKKLLLTLCFVMMSACYCLAQISLVPAAMAKHLPGEWAVVKDSTGKQYTYDEWTRMMASRRFNLKGAGRKKPTDEHQEYLIVPLYNADGTHIVTTAMVQRKPAESEQFHVGDNFKPIREKAIDGEKIDMKKVKGKVYVVNFWFIGCPPCRAEIPDLNKIVEHYKDNSDVIFVAICLDDADRIKQYMLINPLSYHIIDDARVVAQNYGVHLYPTNVVVNRDGKVAYSSVGGQPSNPYWITKTIDEALQTPATVTETTKSK